jgi:hypothetical protein
MQEGRLPPALTWGFSGADDGIRTRDPHLGKVVLYQLSHVRRKSNPTRGVRRPRQPDEAGSERASPVSTASFASAAAIET